jgi:hypothetical protein
MAKSGRSMYKKSSPNEGFQQATQTKGGSMKISQNTLNCKLEYSSKAPTLTSFAGLALVRQSMEATGLNQQLNQLSLKRNGYSDAVIIEAVMLLQASGGQHFSDWESLSAEPGFAKVFGDYPSVDVLERYSRLLDCVSPENSAEKGKLGYVEQFQGLHRHLIRQAYKKAGSPKRLTLDFDTTLIPTGKKDALFCYDKFKAYQPMLVYCPELKMILAYEFRDGNISPQVGYQRLVERCRKLFSKSVKLTVRSDSAGYINDFLDWMEKEKITYFVTADQNEAVQGSLKRAEWYEITIKAGRTQEVALLDHIPDAASIKQMKFRNRTRNYLALRKFKEDKQQDLFENYVYSVIVTNAHRKSAAMVIKRHWGRCGTIEYCNDQLKNQLGLGIMPSNNFTVNTVWFSIGCLTHNLLRLMQKFILPQRFRSMEFKSLRFHLIRSAALVIKKSRRIILRFCKDYRLYEVFRNSQLRLAQF